MSRVVMGALCAGLLVSALACSEQSKLPPPSVLSRSADMELVCFAMDARTAQRETERDPERTAEEQQLREERADRILPLSSCDQVVEPGEEQGVKHALVTQATRGEVAAVDLTNDRVVDSEVRIPGYNFIDVGPFPSAISAPSRDDVGPNWTFVASRGNNSIRAVATCRFLRGRTCGAEVKLRTAIAGEQEAGGAPATFETLTELRLIGAPFDMVFDDGSDSLWVTLPEQGLIARVPLAPSDELQPFPGGLTLAEPEYYQLPVADGRETPAAVADSAVDERLCSTVLPAESTSAAPQVPQARDVRSQQSLGSAQPTRLRLVDAGSGPLLFVADRGQKVLHALRLGTEAGPPEALASMPLGTTIRDFAVTPAVPGATVEGEGGGDARYLYAIDDDSQTSGLMLFALSFAGEVPSLQPLLAPVPQRRTNSVQGMLADRLATSAGTSVPEALDAVDNRGEALSCDPKKIDNEEPDLKGVYVVVAGRDGRLNIIDVHEDPADRACYCDATSEEERLRFRRHTLHMQSFGEGDVSLSNSTQFQNPYGSSSPPEEMASKFAQFRPGEGASPIFLPQDPWQQRPGTWTLTWRGTFSIIEDARIQPSQEQFEVVAPEGFDFCERGIHVAESLPLQLAVLSEPDEGSDCDVPTLDTAQLLNVVEAYRDRLVVEPGRLRRDDTGRLSVPLEQLASCYAGGARLAVRAESAYVVSGPGSTIMHRVVADEEGRCVVDERYGPEFRFMVRPGEHYLDPNIAFRLADAPEEGSETDLMTITLSDLPIPLSIYNVDGSTRQVDTLPTRVRYFANTGDLFVVDAASQGLRTYKLAPFEVQEASFR